MKRITYNTMNSWNNSTAPAYNMKVHKVIPCKLQDKVFDLMQSEDFYDPINDLIHEFDIEMDYQFQAGFNGRSGGYLVLYRGGIERKTYKESDFKNGSVYINDRFGWKSLSEAKAMGIIDKPIVKRIFTNPGKSIETKEVPGHVLRAFSVLAHRIVRLTISMAKHNEVIDETVLIPKTVN